MESAMDGQSGAVWRPALTFGLDCGSDLWYAGSSVPVPRHLKGWTH